MPRDLWQNLWGAGLALVLALLATDTATGNHWPTPAIAAISVLAVLCFALVAAPTLPIQRLRSLWRDPERGTADSVDVPESLAEEIRLRWKDEAKARRLEAADLIAVRWVSNNAIGKNDGDLDGRPFGLTEQVTQIVTQYLHRGSRRLVVVGPPGSGKSALSILILEELMKRRGQKDPIPVILSLSSWDPDERSGQGEGLRSWIVDRLVAEYWPPSAPPKLAEEVTRLVRADLITPILDGLDELTEPVRGKALAAISDVFPSRSLIITCRRREFETLAAAHNQVADAVVIRAQPVTEGAIGQYLQAGRNGPPEKWRTVLTSVQHAGSPLAKAHKNPLTLSLVTWTYKDYNPDALLPFNTATAIRAHLYGRVLDIYSRYMSIETKPQRWPPSRAKLWITNLALHLRDLDVYDMAFWDIPKAIKRPARIMLASALQWHGD